MSVLKDQKKPILVVGGANGERIINVTPDLYSPGRKHVLEQSPPFGAGSSVNHACRLLASGVPVIPVIPVLDDHTGSLIVTSLGQAASHGKTEFDFKTDWYMKRSPADVRNQSTQFTTIVSVGEERTVFSENSNNLDDTYIQHVEDLTAAIEPDDISAVVIGHVYADSKANGEVTKRIINRFSNSVPIVANFGSSQYRHGKSVWSNYLQKLSYFQLDLDEIRRFYDDEKSTINDVLDWFRDLCTVIITLDRKGAIAQVRGSREVMIVWPYELREEFVDTTGAGDAFAATVARELSVNSNAGNPSVETWNEILSSAALGAAYSCCHVGGTENCPTKEELENFKGRRANNEEYIVDTIEASVGGKILRFIDRF